MFPFVIVMARPVATFTVVTDPIALGALKKRNMLLGYITNRLSDAVTDLTIMLVLMAQRRGGKAMTKRAGANGRKSQRILISRLVLGFEARQ